MNYEILKEAYQSPRVTGEYLDCSMPMSFDQYNNCGFRCCYCFSQFQRAVGASGENYLMKKVKKVNLEKFKKIFTDLDDPKNKFRHLIRNRITMQWGGLSDPLCFIEEQEGLGYEILKFLKEIQYPICFSSKSDLLLRDERYFDLFRGMEKLWSYKASIITFDEEKAKIIEAGVPSPQRRLEVLAKLNSIGIWTILRLRPFIIGLTDLTYKELLTEAGKAGVKAVSTEFFCLEQRAVAKSKANFQAISDVLGFDVVQFYRNISNGSGYLRLNRAIKEPYYQEMMKICKEYNMNFHVSDAQGKEHGCSGSCCGLPADADGNPTLTNYSRCQFTNALQIAKRNGFVTWDDIAKDNVWLDDMTGGTAPGFNTGNGEKRLRKWDTSLYNSMRNTWNNPKDANSPYKYFKGILYPEKLDSKKNIVYLFAPFRKEGHTKDNKHYC